MIINKIRDLFKTKEQLLIEQKIRRDRFDAYVDHVCKLHGPVYKGVKYNPIPPPTPEGAGGSGRDMVTVIVLMFVFIVSVMMLVRIMTQDCG